MNDWSDEETEPCRPISAIAHQFDHTLWSDEETEEPLIADHRNFYKVEKWTKDGQRVVEMLFAGSSLDKAGRSSTHGQASAADQADNPAADARAGAVAGYTN